ncbi:hypothetical protein V6N11_062636 [Hibiscus sabdariffa]|uniref:Histidine-containing phosphotransfer protein n=1 Tax=Hibiscus sabdariffa TaxID=183260 RepID=A0ABR2PTA1_9ROSI
MDRNRLQHQVACMRRSLFDQGYLDEPFIQLEELQDDANPNFVQEIVTLFYTDSARLIQNIEHALNSRPIDFDKLDDYMHQFKGSSSSIGAKKVTNECTVFREYCSAENAEGLGCLGSLPTGLLPNVLLVMLSAWTQMYPCSYFGEARVCNLKEEAGSLSSDGETSCSFSNSMSCMP